MILTEDTATLIDRIQCVETKIESIEEKVDTLLEQGELTTENVAALTDSLEEQRDHFQYMRRTLMYELKHYRRIFAIGSFILVLLLFLIMFRFL